MMGWQSLEAAMSANACVCPLTASSARRSQGYRGCFLLIALVCLFLGMAQDAIGGANPSVTIDLGQTGPKQTAVVLQILALLTVLSLAPAFFIMVTSFTRVVIVLSFLRQALGTQSVPPNQVLISLALFITVFVMAPVGEAVYSQAIQPLLAEQISHEEAWTRGIQPIRAFMLKQVRDKDLELFIDLSKRPKPETVDQVPIHGGSQCADVHGNDDVASNHDFPPIQAHSFCAGRWVELSRRVAGEKLSMNSDEWRYI
jgi:flagellar biosynthesis protein FliP